MKSTMFLMAAALSLMNWAGAQPVPLAQIVDVSPGSRTHLALYSRPGDSTPLRKIEVAQLAFPLDVGKAEQGYLLISLNGEQVWVRSVDVQQQKRQPHGDEPTGLQRGANAQASGEAVSPASAGHLFKWTDPATPDPSTPPPGQHTSEWAVPAGIEPRSK